jgi:Cdc6-like AAA superfamily ATPase
MYVPELQETKVEPLPAASLDTLKALREEMCSQSASRDFKLQSHQSFLRRILSPDAPTRSLLMVHGTGTGKTCSAIQIAEEYIIRPEFQESKVLVVCQPAVQRNFRKQIFDDSKVNVDPDGLVLSKQCTGRRYLDMLQRTQREPLKWSSRQVREKMVDIVKKDS